VRPDYEKKKGRGVLARKETDHKSTGWGGVDGRLYVPLKVKWPVVGVGPGHGHGGNVAGEHRRGANTERNNKRRDAGLASAWHVCGKYGHISSKPAATGWRRVIVNGNKEIGCGVCGDATGDRSVFSVNIFFEPREANR